jgi:hypothetical protein
MKNLGARVVAAFFFAGFFLAAFLAFFLGGMLGRWISLSNERLQGLISSMRAGCQLNISQTRRF